MPNKKDTERKATPSEANMARYILEKTGGCPFGRNGCDKEGREACVQCISEHSGSVAAGAPTDGDEEHQALIHAFTAGTFNPKTGTAGFAAFLCDAEGVEIMHTEGSFDTAKAITGYDAELAAFESIDIMLKLYDGESGYYLMAHPAEDKLRRNFGFLYDNDEKMRRCQDPDGNRYVEYFGDGNWFCTADDDSRWATALSRECMARAMASAAKTERGTGNGARYKIGSAMQKLMDKLKEEQ